VDPQKLDILSDAIGHRQTGLYLCRTVSSLDHPLARFDLRLPKVEDGDAIGVGEIIRGAEGFGFVIGLPAEMMPDDPFAWPAERFAVAERQTGSSCR
jgi:hypothetical protein